MFDHQWGMTLTSQTPAGRVNPWAAQVSSYLDTAVSLKVTSSPAAKQAHEQILANIIESIQQAAREMDIEANLEIKELEVPEIKGKECGSRDKR